MNTEINITVRLKETVSDAFVIGIDCECKNCGKHDLVLDEKQESFAVTPTTLIVPVVCQRCGYSSRVEIYL